MSVQIKSLMLRSKTPDRMYGADITLGPGLNIITAGNTSGKSTCLQAILYCLGLERMLGPRLEIPFPHAMKERIRQNPQSPYEDVVESFAELVLENTEKSILTIHRGVVGQNDKRLVRARISEIDKSPIDRDFYLHDSGSAQNESGFHLFLAHYLGWELPEVSTFDGREVLLYLETIFPLLFVEQKRGWSAVQGPFPTFLRIQDVARRSLEFLLSLEVGLRRRKRLELRKSLSALQSQWENRRNGLLQEVGTLVRFENVSAAPDSSFWTKPNINIEIYRGQDWLPLAEVVEMTSVSLKELEASETPSTEDATPALQSELVSATLDIDNFLLRIDSLRLEMNAIRDDISENDRRIRALQTDLVRNQDALKLENFGSKLGRAASTHLCPTCHQELEAELLPSVDTPTMALAENISFIKSQIALYGASASGSRKQAAEVEIIYRTVNEELREAQNRVRQIREALTKPSQTPTRSLIENIVRTQSRLTRLQSIRQIADSLSDELAAVSERYDEKSKELRELGPDQLTITDRKKLGDFEGQLQSHLTQFGFRTFPVNDIKIAEDDFRPVAAVRDKDGQYSLRELSIEMSASDGIRLKWAYYLALMEVGYTYKIEHPGLIVFDEPDQQAIEQIDVKSFLSEATKIGKGRQIVVAATSEKIAGISETLKELGAKIIAFDGYALQPIPNVFE